MKDNGVSALIFIIAVGVIVVASFQMGKKAGEPDRTDYEQIRSDLQEYKDCISYYKRLRDPINEAYDGLLTRRMNKSDVAAVLSAVSDQYAQVPCSL